MMEKLLENRQKLFILATVVLAVVYIVLFIYFKLNPSMPRLISSSPIDLSKDVALAKLPTFEFDKPIDLTDVVIISSPKTSWVLTQTKATNITATHTPDFQPATTYTISLTWKNKPLAGLEFKTLASQVDPLLLQEMKEELARDYPLARFTPYKTSNYRVVYSSPMTFEITMINSNLTSEDAIEEVKSWITKNGGDAASHKLVVITQ